jgi:hypothetical protein
LRRDALRESTGWERLSTEIRDYATMEALGLLAVALGGPAAEGEVNFFV